MITDLTEEGDDTGYGQALFPVPAQDPNDPLQVRIEPHIYAYDDGKADIEPSVVEFQEIYDPDNLLGIFILGQQCVDRHFTLYQPIRNHLRSVANGSFDSDILPESGIWI